MLAGAALLRQSHSGLAGPPLLLPHVGQLATVGSHDSSRWQPLRNNH